MSLNFYNKYTIKDINIEFPDLYFTPEYGEACEYSDNAEWECCIFEDLIYTYLKLPSIISGITYYNLLTPYGYSGYYYKNKCTYDTFIPLFRSIAVKRNYLTEILRQNPYINVDISNYDILKKKTIFAIKVDNYQIFLKKVLHKDKKENISIATKLGFTFTLHEIDNIDLMNNFITLYNNNMKRINASDYYYFNDAYYNSLKKINNAHFAVVRNSSNNIIGMSILFIFKHFIHYHLSCNDNSSKSISCFLITNVVKNLSINKLFILGGGVVDNDGLYNFKNSLSNIKIEYVIYKNVLH
jgi:hypothetical protein